MVKTQTQVARWSIQVSVPRCGTDAPLLAIIKALTSESSERSPRIWPLKDGFTQVTLHLCHRQQWAKDPLLRLFFQITQHFEFLLLDQATHLASVGKVTQKPQVLWSCYSQRGQFIQHGFCSMTAQCLVETPHCSSHAASLRFYLHNQSHFVE